MLKFFKNNKKKFATKKRKVTPTYIQMEATECGAVCLQIILAYYGKQVSLEELRINCGVSRDGSSAALVIEAAEGYGMEAEGYACELESLYNKPLPAIIFWKFEHFLVLEGFDKKRVFINDPATGPRTITHKDLDESFTGVVLTLKRGPNFVKQKTQPWLFQRIYNRLYGLKMPFIYIAITEVCLIFLNLSIPAFARIFVDQVLVNHELGWKTFLVMGMLLTISLIGILTSLQGYILNWLLLVLRLRFSSSTLWHMLRLPYSFYTQRYPGEIAFRMTLNDSLANTIATTLVPLALDSLSVVIYGAVIFYYDIPIGAVALVAAALNFLLAGYVFRSRQDAYACYQADIGKSNSYSISALHSMETVKATGSEYNFFSLWIAYYTKIISALIEIGKKDIFLGVSQPLLIGLTSVAVIGVGGWRIMEGYLTTGMFIALTILVSSFTSLVCRIIGQMRNLQMFKVELARIDDVMRYPLDPLLDKVEQETGGELQKLKGYIELRNVNFTHSPRDPNVLNDISLTLSPGKSTALVGPTGCGKSTITKIIAGLYAPTSGEVLFDGQRIEDVPRTKITSSMAVIEQEPFIFSGTVQENLTLMGFQIFQEDLVKAAKDAVIHEQILSRKGGYEFQIQEMGSNLSGGERQCFEIARGLVKNPTIILMDEATSSLDSETESKVIINVQRRGCTTLMIAHRLSTIRNCDEIIVMEKGSIVARGTHEELSSIPGLYRTLIESEHTDI